MATPCPVCHQHNPDGALYCEFCKTPFRRGSPLPRRSASSLLTAEPGATAAPRGAPAADSGPPPPARGVSASRWPVLSFPLVGLVAVVSAGLGFVARGYVAHARSPPVAQLPEMRSLVSPPAPPLAGPIPARCATLAPESQVAAAPVVVPAAAVADTAVLPSPSAPAPAPTVAPDEPQVPALKQITVPYRALEGHAQRIIIPVKLNDRVTAEMALDTGTPGTVIFAPLAKRLGVLEEGSNRLMTTMAGIGGQTSAVLVVLDSLSVDEARTEFVPTMVTAPLTNAFEGLVGMDFLADYSIQIDTQQHRLLLTELPESSARPAGHDEAWWRRTFAQMQGQLTLWHRVHARLQERVSRSHVTGDGSAELLRFAERQEHEAEELDSRLERFASNHAVPRKWRGE